ncbi:MAG: RNA polymerase sigma factor [Bifidobacteriaceae bacterium]|nr:RNA polymerase sigma factor [Bifidobacteriaceae bacterium]
MAAVGKFRDIGEQPESVAAPFRAGLGRAGAARREREFTRLFTADYPRILAYLLRREAEPETARDIAAEVFRIAWEKDGPLPDAPWLFVTARNLLANSNRSRVRAAELRQTIINHLTRDSHPGSAPAPPAPSAEEDQVRQILARLPEPQREILTAHYWDGLSGAECAALLGCSIPAVWKRLSRARAMFKTLLAQTQETS